MITITIKLFASLKDGRFDIREFQCAGGTTVQEMLNSIGIREGEYHISFVNNRHAPPAQKLMEGDILGVFPAVGGG